MTGDPEFTPTGWFRVRNPEGRLWAETSSLAEAMRAHRETGWPIEQLWERVETEWRPM
jgi:hypothetical protein